MANKEKKTEDQNRRCGFVRRSFTYAQYIPERRKGGERRETNTCDLELDDQTSPVADQTSNTTGNDNSQD